MSVQEVPASETYVIATMQFVTNEFNRESDDKYSFRIVRVLKVKKLVSFSPLSSPCIYVRGLLALWGKPTHMSVSGI